jgi:hypothetical protein
MAIQPTVGPVQTNGVNTAAGTTSYVMLTGTNLAVNQAVTIKYPAANPTSTWAGSLVWVSAAKTVGLAAVGPPSGPGGSAPATAGSCQVTIADSIPTTVSVDVYNA